MASQITAVSIAYSTVCSGTDQRKHQSSTSLALVQGIHRWLVNSLHKRPVTRKMFSFWWRHHDPLSSHLFWGKAENILAFGIIYPQGDGIGCWNSFLWKAIICSAVDKPKFMGRASDHPWWKTGSPESFLGCPNYFELFLKDICFLIINTKFACFLLNHVPTYREVGRPSGNFGGHVGSPDRVMSHIWRLGNLLSTALFYVHHT